VNLRLIEAAVDEIISLKEAKEYLRIDHDFDDEVITTLIKSTREAMESVVQKTILKQTWEYTIYNDIINNLTAKGEKHPSFSNGLLTIPLPKPPIIKIIHVTLDSKELELRQYRFEKIGARFSVSIIYRSIPNYKNVKAIAITYEAGIVENAKEVPYQLKLANLMLLANAYQERYSYKSEGIMSAGVRQLLSPFLNLRLC
jgi:uncharacterized phage protein (predicted DNA packaging)